jgi:hypothetical protein
MSIRSDEFQLQRDSLEEVQKIRTEISKLSSSLRDNLSTLVGTNGLDLSLYTLRNMQRISKGSPVERLAPKNLTARDIVNVLGIDVQIALLLERAFESDATIEAISTLPGMSPEIMQRVKESFLLTDG